MMAEVDDDPELTRLAREHNAELQKEIDAQVPTPDGVAPVLSADDAIRAPRGTLPVANPADGLDLGEDLARIDAAAELGLPEEFESEDLEIKVSENLADFRDAVALAEMNGITSIQASKKVIFHFTKPNYPANGFFLYHGIRVDEAGRTEEIEKLLAKTTEEVTFGKGR
jgi:hypothetical protein